MNSINVSLGTAVVLGLEDAPVEVAPKTAYLLLGGRCSMNCAFCPQALRSDVRRNSPPMLSRVTWPDFEEGETLARLADSFERGEVKRCCIQVTVSEGYIKRTLGLVKAIKRLSDIPVDVAILPKSVAENEALVESGVDHIGFGLDAACERVFQQVKGGNWRKFLLLIEETAGCFPGHVAVHLIVGLGESEREMAEMIQTMHDLGVIIGLFAFTPVRGTALAGSPPPRISTYRKMQVALYLISNDYAKADDFSFSPEGRLVSFNTPNLLELLSDGVAFQTSGCPHCNRPFYNERPGGVIYNYPRPLSGDEIRRACCQISLLT